MLYLPLRRDQLGDYRGRHRQVWTYKATTKARHTPFAVREVARQLKEMQAIVNGVISPSQSPWARPVMIDGEEEERDSSILC